MNPLLHFGGEAWMNFLYEIRRDGETVCVSSVPGCGYSEKLLRKMVADGYRYYIGGKLQRKV